MCKHLLKIQRLILALLIFGGGVFYTSSATARVCFLPDSTDCGEGDVDVPDVQVTCATYGGYEKVEDCLEARTNKTAQTCTLNSGCYYPKCAYDSERNCKNDNPDKKCLSQDVDGVKCWYSQPKTCSEQGYKTSCGSDETATKVDVEASNAPCYTCAKKKTCKMMNYYGSKDNCPNPTSNYERKETNYTDKDGDKCYTCEPKACTKLNSSYKNKYNKDTCGSGKKSQKVDGTDSAADGPCYTCEDKPVEKNCSDINKFYMNKDQAKLCNKQAVPIHVVGSDGQCYLCGITESCDGKESKIYYIAYPPYYLKGDVAYESGCKCSSPYLVKGISSNTDPLNPGGPININAISTPGGNSSSTEKIHLPTTLIGVSSSNPYSVKIDEFQCYGEEHCSAQVVKLDVLEKYVPDVAKKLKEDDDYLIDGGNFYDDFYYYTGRQFKPKSQSINTCDDYVVILGNGNPKACAQISSDYYNYHESCPKGLEKKRLPNVYDSTGAQCFTCEKATPVITITYKETYNSLTPGTDADSEEYYYRTLKFTATSSDNISRTILMKTYPAMTCSKPQYTTGSPVTINEGTETIIGSRCGTQSRPLLVSSVAALDTFINGTKVYSFKPYSSRTLYDDLDGTTVETNDYTVKFVKEKTCTPTCTSETGCKYGSKTQSDGCGGTCTVCYPPCAIGYWYGSLAQENCYIKPAKYIKQPSNHNCSKCVCDNGKPDANGHYLQCQYFQIIS